MMKNSTLEIYKDSLALSKAFTSFLKKIQSEYPVINLSLSGGSTPKALFDYWAEEKKCLEWDKISFFWGDERCVSPDHEMSNFGMTQKHLFDKIPEIPSQNIFRIKGENDPQEEAIRYGNILSSHVPKKNSLPCFEVIMLGLGEDGHTASIFPDQLELWNSTQNCVVATHPENKGKRISLSGNVINNAQHVVFLVTGKGKAEKVRDCINYRQDFISKYPAANVDPANGFLHWFLDEEAAGLL